MDIAGKMNIKRSRWLAFLAVLFVAFPLRLEVDSEGLLRVVVASASAKDGDGDDGGGDDGDGDDGHDGDDVTMATATTAMMIVMAMTIMTMIMTDRRKRSASPIRPVQSK